MKVPVFDIKRFAVHDGPGIRTTVFLKGCPLRCKWCHNPEGLIAEPQLSYIDHKCALCGACANVCSYGVHEIKDGRHTVNYANCKHCGKCVSVCQYDVLKIYGEQMTAETVAQIVLQDKLFYKNSGGGVTISGGEPLIWAEYVHEVLSILKKEGIHTAIDTSGLVAWKNFETVLDVTDLFLFDVKHSDPIKHKSGTGVDNALILENLSRLSETGKPIEVRIPLITGYNDDEENLMRTGKILKNIKTLTKAVILPYHDFSDQKYRALGWHYDMPNVRPPDAQAVSRADSIIADFCTS